MVSFFLISLPSAYIIGIGYEFGIDGLWYGYSIGLLVLNFMYFRLLLTSDIKQIVMEIRQSIQKQIEELESSDDDNFKLSKSIL